MNSGKLHFLFLALLLCSGASARAESNRNGIANPQKQCSEVLEECFGYAGSERSNCFYSAAHHPFCEGSRLGKIISKRWALSPTMIPGAENVPGFLGPQLVDAECLAGVDREWYGKILNQEISDESSIQIGARLDACVVKIPIELPRP
jgi:hypothetical protein